MKFHFINMAQETFPFLACGERDTLQWIPKGNDTGYSIMESQPSGEV